jgi:spermidine/putrescine transport system substrate-binding protein
VDNWVIPAASEHPVAAHRWIDFMLEPRAAAREMEYHAYPVPVRGIERFVDPELARDPIIAIPDETIERYETQLQTPRGQQQRDRIYTEFRAA